MPARSCATPCAAWSGVRSRRRPPGLAARADRTRPGAGPPRRAGRRDARGDPRRHRPRAGRRRRAGGVSRTARFGIALTPHARQQLEAEMAWSRRRWGRRPASSCRGRSVTYASRRPGTRPRLTPPRARSSSPRSTPASGASRRAPRHRPSWQPRRAAGLASPRVMSTMRCLGRVSAPLRRGRRRRSPSPAARGGRRPS